MRTAACASTDAGVTKAASRRFFPLASVCCVTAMPGYSGRPRGMRLSMRSLNCTARLAQMRAVVNKDLCSFVVCGGGIRKWNQILLAAGRNQILLEFAVGVRIGRERKTLRRVLDAKDAERHAAAESFAGLVERERIAERTEAVAIVRQRLRVKVGIEIG